MSGGLTPPVVSFLVRNPSVSCVKPQLACHRLSHSLQAVQLKSKFAAFYEYFTSRLQGGKKKSRCCITVVFHFLERKS